MPRKPTSSTPRTPKRKAPLDPETERRKQEFLALRAELNKQPRISHKERTARMHARAAEALAIAEAKLAEEKAAAAARAQQEREAKEREALERRYAKNPFLRPIPPSAQSLGAARVAIRGQGDPRRAESLAKYLQASPGQYGEGDRFLGVTVPIIRAIAKQFSAMRLDFAVRLLRSKYHEERLLALFILNEQFRTGPPDLRRTIVDTYLEHRAYVNNWDLIDSSAPNLLGADAFQYKPSRELLRTFAKSPLVWERRMAIVATFYFIKHGQLTETIRLAHVLVQDPHDLIRKAVGWMLREVGKRDRALLLQFLDEHHHRMPRVMFRYAVEHLTAAERAPYR
jgi:3-methyladenine DNA glycosylase AlkD